MFRIDPCSEDYPNAIEAQKARQEAHISGELPMTLFMSKPVSHVLCELESCCGEKSYLFVCGVFNYGYIMGKRAERARRAKSKQADT